MSYSSGATLNKPLQVLMISHFPTYRTYPRSQVMAKHLAQRGHHISLMAISNHRRFGVVETEWDGIRIIETPDLLWG